MLLAHTVQSVKMPVATADGRDVDLQKPVALIAG